MIGLFVFLWFMVGAIGGALTGYYFDVERKAPEEQAWAAGLAAFALGPLVPVIFMGYSAYKVVPFLGRGFAGIYRTFFPAKMKLPKAKVHL